MNADKPNDFFNKEESVFNMSLAVLTRIDELFTYYTQARLINDYNVALQALDLISEETIIFLKRIKDTGEMVAKDDAGQTLSVLEELRGKLDSCIVYQEDGSQTFVATKDFVNNLRLLSERLRIVMHQNEAYLKRGERSIAASRN